MAGQHMPGELLRGWVGVKPAHGRTDSGLVFMVFGREESVNRASPR